MKYKKNILRTMPIEKILGSSGRSSLPRTLGAFELTMMGVGVTIGSGIFVITGVAAAEHAGPGLILSFVFAGIVCCCAALCYSELSSMIPASGSAYTFAYAGLGEAAAWFIGWCLTLEYVVAMSAVSVGWSAYMSNVLLLFNAALPPELTEGPFNGGMMNVPAMGIITVMALLQLRGSKESAKLNNILVTVKIAVIVIFVILVAPRIDPANYDPFLPFGWSGVLSGAAVVFFAYIGFDALCNSAEEVINPQKNMPKSILLSLLIVTILYIAVTLMLTGVESYDQYSGVAAPVAYALNKAGVQWGSALVSVGAVAGLSTSVLIMLGSQSRLIFSMARDGLLPASFAKISRQGVPTKAVFCVWAVGCALAGFLPIDTIAELCNIGTLWAFFIVSAVLIILRVKYPKMKRAFRVPAVPLVPIMSMGLCAVLAYQLDETTWKIFGTWTSVGILIYFFYGRWNSKMRS